MLREPAQVERARLDRLESLLRDPIVVGRLSPAVVAGLHQLVKQQRASLITFLGGEQLSWAGFQQRRRTGDRVLAECLAVVAGAFTRPIPSVASSCAQARCLAQEIYGLTQLAGGHDIIAAETECAGLMSSVVRRRFPDHGIWDLPIIAHEFGHLVVRDLLDVNPLSGQTSRPLAEFIAGRKVQTAELAADIFAVYMLGPAYVLTLVLHRMDPTAPAVSADDATHPGDSSRVAAVLHVLGLLAAGDIEERRDQYAFLQEHLGNWWTAAQANTKSEARLDEHAAARVRNDAERLWNMLATSKLAGISYVSFVNARSLANGFDGGGTPASASSARDVLNAAWLARFRAWRDGSEMPKKVEGWAAAELDRLQQSEEADLHGGTI